MAAIILQRDHAAYLVDVALSAASRDDVTPVICGARVTVEDEHVRVVATDRYRVHTTKVRAIEAQDDFDAIIPRDALLWLKKNIGYFGSSGRHSQRVTILMGQHVKRSSLVSLGDLPGVLCVTVSQTDADDSASIQWNGTHVVGKFPPVLRLVEEARAAEPAAAPPLLNMSYVAKIARLSRGAHQPLRVKFTASKGTKPGVVYFSVEHETGLLSEALLQPHVEMRNES